MSSDSPLPPAKRQKLDSPSSEQPAQEKASFVTESAAEKKVGITEFLNAGTTGFTGILKQRYTDFMVNEIDQEGNVVHLTEIGVKKRAKSEEKVEAPTEKGNNATEETATKAEEFSLSDEDKELLITALGSEAFTQLLQLHDTILKDPKNVPKNTSISSLPIEEKGQRSSLHQALRRIFNSRFDSTTGADNTIVIKLAQSGQKKGRNARMDRKSMQEQYPNGQFLHFTLYKENKDTMEVISTFVRNLKVNNHQRFKTFSFAGTKDRRAVTVQRCSAHRMNEERLASMNKAPKGRPWANPWRVGNFEWKETGLELGDLQGNEFTITLRDVQIPNQDTTKEGLESILAQACSDLERDGFINYYGLQRFGTFSKGTHDIGRKLFQSDWYGAIREILDYDPSALTDPLTGRDDRDRARAIEMFFTGGKEKYQEALKLMPRKFTAEDKIIFQVMKQGMDPRSTAGNWLHVFMNIPRNLRTMYIHSYQSYVWNHVASERIRRYGKTVVKGDLVLINPTQASSAAMVEPEFDQDGDPIITDASSAPNTDFPRARPLTAEEASSGTYTLSDIVLPTPGFDITYPDNDLMDVYKSIMSKDGLDPLAMKRAQKETSMPGSYRPLIGRLLGPMEFCVKELAAGEQMARTDLQVLEGKDVEAPVEGSREDGEQQEDKKLAVMVRFKLGTSMYATMALRELLKDGGVRSYVPEFSRERGSGGVDAAVEKAEAEARDVRMEE